MENAFPRCRKCSEGDLVPLSDFGSQGASIEYKAWVCTNPSCLYNIKIRNGDITVHKVRYQVARGAASHLRLKKLE